MNEAELRQTAEQSLRDRYPDLHSAAQKDAYGEAVIWFIVAIFTIIAFLFVSGVAIRYFEIEIAVVAIIVGAFRYFYISRMRDRYSNILEQEIQKLEGLEK